MDFSEVKGIAMAVVCVVFFALMVGDAWSRYKYEKWRDKVRAEVGLPPMGSRGFWGTDCDTERDE